MENTTKTIDANVKTITKNIIVKATMQSYLGSPFDYEVSIDDVGQIVLTPNSLDTVFINTNSPDEYVEDNIIDPDMKPTYSRGPANSVNKDFIIKITATMLCDENSQGHYSADTDAIGQCVICPMNKFDSFVTASVDDDLNLITEDYEVQEYMGYKMYNMGDGWDVLNPEGELVEEGIATLTQAQMFVCREELNRLKKLNRKDEQVMYESLQSEIETDLVNLTNNYEDSEGMIYCENTTDQEICVKLLSRNYTVTPMEHDGKLVVKYTKDPIVEELHEEELTKDEIISRFLMGDLPLFSYEGTPEESFIYIPELDSKGYKYYYDPESGSIISFKVDEL